MIKWLEVRRIDRTRTLLWLAANGALIGVTTTTQP